MAGALRVLIVDDNPDDRALAARELGGEFPDIRTIEVADATTFETALERGGFDLVITEFHLAWSDGLSVFRELKYRYPEIPVIMLTGAGSEEIAVEAMRVGLDDYVLKSPEHVVRLPVIATSVLERARERQARRQAEEALRSSEAHLRALFASMSDVILVLDRDGRYLEIAPTSPELLYRPAAETLGKTVHELFSPEQADHFLEAVRRALDTHSTVEIEYTLQIGGEDMRFAASISPMLEDSVVWVARDITERKRAEEELKRSRTEFAQMVDNIVDVVFLLGVEPDDTYRFLSVNGSFLTVTGLKAHDVIGKRIQEVLPEAVHAVALAKYQEAIRERKTVRWQGVSVYPAGERVGDVSVTPVFDGGGRCTRLVATVHDITERKKAEDALRESEELFRTSFENATVGVCLVGTDGRFLRVNGTMCELLGYTEEELQELTFNDVTHSEDTEIGASFVASALSGDVNSASFEKRYVHKDRHAIWAFVSSALLHDAAGEPEYFITHIRDITERKRAEEALRRSEGRVRELLGHLFRAQEEERERIAGGIHDDSIQVMTAVVLRLETLQRRLTDPEVLESLKPLAETVTSAIARLRHLMFELHPRVLDEDGLAPALRMHLDRMSEQVQIEYTLSNHLEQEPALGTRTVLYRIAQEALVNVRKHANAARVEVVLEPRESGYAVCITDDGSGFELGGAECEAPGRLGLAAMRERAEMVGGWWRIESTPGSGTTVEFWVPAEVD